LILLCMIIVLILLYMIIVLILLYMLPRDGLHLNFAGTPLLREKFINIIKHVSVNYIFISYINCFSYKCIHLYHVCVAFAYWNLFFLFSGSWHPEHGAVPLSESILGLYILRVDLFSPSLPLWVLKREIILWIREGIFSNKHLVYTYKIKSVSFSFRWFRFVSFRFCWFRFVSLRFVSFSLISFRFISFLFRFALYRYPPNVYIWICHFNFFTQINIFWYNIIYWTPGRKTLILNYPSFWWLFLCNWIQRRNFELIIKRTWFKWTNNRTIWSFFSQIFIYIWGKLTSPFVIFNVYLTYI
jgi:hypothetical protein